MLNEISAKHQRIIGYMREKGLSCIVLSSRPNFSWLTGGKLNYVNPATETGVASLIITSEKIVCLTTNIESQRIADEELSGSGIEVSNHYWHDGDKRSEIFRELIPEGKTACDIAVAGLPADSSPLDSAFDVLRWSLLPEEISRYKDAGSASSLAMEKTISQITPGMTEFEIAGLAARNIYNESARPWVLLIAADERIKKYRHPIPTGKKLEKMAMIVFCVEKHGLICSLTRIVSFGPIDDEIRKKHDATVKIDAAVNYESTEGKSLSGMFDFICGQYAEVGYGDEYNLHHQGGPTGYKTRDCIALPTEKRKLLNNQAFAWNPSITGTKSEDTIIMTDGKPIIVTQASSNWPMIEVKYKGKTMLRPDILRN